MTKKPKKHRMSKNEYVAALKKLGLTTAGKATAEALGLGVRHCQRIANGETKVPGPVENLLNMYLEYGTEHVLQRENDG
jgi:hypothetical protein